MDVRILTEEGLEFEWDVKKAKENLKAHQVSFEEAKTVFNDPFSITIRDPQHSLASIATLTLVAL